MPDLDSVLARVEDELVVVTRRCEELDGQRAALDRQRVRLVAAVEVMKEHAVPPAVPPAASAGPADPQPLTERILAALVNGSAHRRADLVRVFLPLGVTENALDSAVQRLKKRGMVRREGRLLVPVVQPSAPASPPESFPVSSVGSGAARPQDDLASIDVDLDSGCAGVPGTVSVPEGPVQSPLSADGEQFPLTTRVLEAVASSIAVTRRALVGHFAAQGIKEASVDTALSGLRKRGRLERRAGGVLVVPALDVSSAPVGVDSPDL